MVRKWVYIMRRSEMIKKLTEHLMLHEIFKNEPEKTAEIILKMQEEEGMLPPAKPGLKIHFVDQPFEWESENDQDN